MKKPTKEQLEERYYSLPEDIQQAITSEEVSRSLENVGTKYKLRMDKTGEMIDEVGMVMLGFSQSAEFIDNLTRRLKVDRETAESLAVDIDNDVFKKIRESLREVQFGERGDQQSPEAAQAGGDSPVRDSLLKEVEKHGNEDTPGFAATTDYSADAFGLSSPEPARPKPTPYQESVSKEEKLDPNKTFKDHLEKKIEAEKPKINADPYRESID